MTQLSLDQIYRNALAHEVGGVAVPEFVGSRDTAVRMRESNPRPG
jgi:hypothetical protein